jgi:hypothetical protein
MLSDQHFYYSLTRKAVILFGNMFNNISVIRKNRDNNDEIERFKVPLMYGPKEKYYARLQQDPDLQKPVQLILPRMSFEINSITYDVSRKQNSLLRAARGNNSTRTSSQYMGVPYDIGFTLEIYTRNIDDGTHIVEQILPYFNPDYTISVNLVPELGFLKDVPIILNSVDNSIEHEGNFDAIRMVNWTLTFTMKTYYYGPISNPKIIRKAITNINADPSILINGNLVRINTTQGNNGTYKLNDVVYQGTSYETATAYGVVENWAANTGKLVIGGTQGNFKVNNVIHAVSTNAAYNLASFDISTLKYATIVVEPDPLTANVGDDFGYTTTITEWPETNT